MGNGAGKRTYKVYCLKVK